MATYPSSKRTLSTYWRSLVGEGEKIYCNTIMILMAYVGMFKGCFGDMYIIYDGYYDGSGRIFFKK